MTASSKDAPTWDSCVPIYEQLLQHSAPLSFPPPWDFIPAQPNCVGPVADPTAVLADLRGRFDDRTLQAAAVLCTSAHEGPHLNSLFTHPDSALVALRDPLDGPLVGLLTSRCGLPTWPPPTFRVIEDHFTRRALVGKGVLYVTPKIREVALLRALGMPATLSLDMAHMTYTELQKVSNHFRECPTDRACVFRPTVALLGCSLLPLSTEASPAMLPAVDLLTHARRDLDIPLPGVQTWRLRADDIEKLRYWLHRRDARAIQAVLADRAEELYQIETLLPTSGVAEATDADPVLAFAATRAKLDGRLSNAPALGPLPPRAQRARKLHNKQVERTLIQPLEKYFLASTDPVARNVGAQLTNVFRLLHHMDPLLLSQLTRQYDAANQGVSAPLPPEMLKQYLALTGRMGNLVRDLSQWGNT